MILYAQGEYDAFEELYSRYSGKVFGYLKNRMPFSNEASDLLQLVFLKVHKSRDKYDPSFPFLPWIFTIARHTLFDHLRKSIPIPINSAKLSLKLDKFQQNIASEQAEKTDWDEILKGLPEKQRELIKLRFEEEMSFEQIAEKSGITEISARKRLSRALRSVRKLVGTDKKGF